MARTGQAPPAVMRGRRPYVPAGEIAPERAIGTRLCHLPAIWGRRGLYVVGDFLASKSVRDIVERNTPSCSIWSWSCNSSLLAVV
jgi:hypothetical protein